MKIKQTFKSVALLAALFFGTTVVAGNSTVTCIGFATDQNQIGVEGVKMTNDVTGRSTYTDSEGMYFMENLPYSSHISATAPSGYSITSSSISQSLTQSEEQYDVSLRKN